VLSEVLDEALCLGVRGNGQDYVVHDVSSSEWAPMPDRIGMGDRPGTSAGRLGTSFALRRARSA
jgi:hypothetical protein